MASLSNTRFFIDTYRSPIHVFFFSQIIFPLYNFYYTTTYYTVLNSFHYKEK